MALGPPQAPLRAHVPDGAAGLSPTTKSCSNAAAATEEPRVEGKVHNSREGPVETAAARSAFSLAPGSGDRELRDILLLRGSYQPGGGEGGRLPGRRGSRALPGWYFPGSPASSTVTERSWEHEPHFILPPPLLSSGLVLFPWTPGILITIAFELTSVPWLQEAPRVLPLFSQQLRGRSF